MANQYYSEKHYRLVCSPPDTKADIDYRIARNKALEIVRDEIARLYPQITAENAVEMLRYQEKRIKELGF